MSISEVIMLFVSLSICSCCAFSTAAEGTTVRNPRSWKDQMQLDHKQLYVKIVDGKAELPTDNFIGRSQSGRTSYSRPKCPRISSPRERSSSSNSRRHRIRSASRSSKTQKHATHREVSQKPPQRWPHGRSQHSSPDKVQCSWRGRYSSTQNST